MLFNSVEYILFLPLVFVVYWILLKHRVNSQNILLLIASYIFYGWWDYRFLSLIAASTCIDYFTGIRIYNSRSRFERVLYLWLSISFNLGILGFFKYYNFFIDSWINLLQSIGYTVQNAWTLHIILPVGISFYTFQTMSYTLDIYKGELKPTKDFIAFASFVSFFPQLVAGPIERASNLLPQMLNRRSFRYDQCVEGLKFNIMGNVQESSHCRLPGSSS